MERFRVAVCQVRAFDLEGAEENLQNLLAALDEAGRQGAQLVGLPECAYPAYYV
jgi:predicted amidohydrolase